SPGEPFDPSPVNIESRLQRPPPIGGLKLALLPKKTRGGRVQATLQLEVGGAKSLMNRSHIGGLTAAMLMRGTRKRSRQEIQDTLDRLRSSAYAFGGGQTVSVFIDTYRESLPSVLELVAEELRQPSFPAAEFAQLKKEQLSQLESTLNE